MNEYKNGARSNQLALSAREIKDAQHEAAFHKNVTDILEVAAMQRTNAEEKARLLTERNNLLANQDRQDVRGYTAPPGLRSRCEAALNDAPSVRKWIRAKFKYFRGVADDFYTAEDREVLRVLNTADTFGAANVPTEVSEVLLNLLSVYGAVRTLGYFRMPTGKTKFPQIATKPYAAWLTSSNNDAAALITGSIIGSATQTDCGTVAATIDVSTAIIEDNKMSSEGAILESLVTSIYEACDRAAFVADGSDDAVDGLQVGIFAHSGVTNFSAGAGRTSVASLALVDFCGTIGSVSTAALQHACRWWISPAFLPKLMLIADNNEKILKPPTTPGGEWMLAGFPCTWVASAPAVDSFGKQVAAFGRGDAYLFGIARDFELRKTESQERAFTSNLAIVRATMRAQAVMQDAASFAVLKTAAA